MDLGLMQFVQAWQPDWLTQVMRLVSALSDTPSYFFAVPLIAAYYFRHGRRRLALATVLVTAGNLLNPLIKSIVERPRPTTDIVSVLEQTNHSSFPSGHALGAMVFYGFLAWIAWTSGRRWLAAGCAAFILLVGVSRMYLGAHWPSDVAAGYVIGFVWLLALRWLVPVR
jgi:undecaprenyl-diphosphatase